MNTTGAGIMHGPGITHASLHDVLAGRAPIGAEVRGALRAAHASTSSHEPLVDTLRARVAEPAAPGTRDLLASWVEFTAGTVTVDEIQQALSPHRPS